MGYQPRFFWATYYQKLSRKPWPNQTKSKLIPKCTTQTWLLSHNKKRRSWKAQELKVRVQKADAWSNKKRCKVNAGVPNEVECL